MDVRRLYKSDTDKMICGVCGGIGEFLNVDPTLVRLLWAILTFTGPGLIAYIIAAIIIPGPSGLKKRPEDIWGPGQSHAVRSLFFSAAAGDISGTGLLPWPAPRSEKDMCQAFPEEYGSGRLLYKPPVSGNTFLRKRKRGEPEAMGKKKQEPVDPNNLKPEDVLKFEIAAELGLADKVVAGGWRCLTAKESGRIGGLITRKKREMAGQKGENQTLKDEKKDPII